MKLINKKLLKIFSSGSLLISTTIVKEQKKVKFYLKDYQFISLTNEYKKKTFLANSLLLAKKRSF